MTGDVQAQARATPSPCRAAILAREKESLSERVALLIYMDKVKCMIYGSGE